MTATQGESSAVHIGSILWMVFLDAGLALLVYFGLRIAGVGTSGALIGAALVTGLRVLAAFVRARRFEGFAAFILIGLIVGIGLSFVTGSERFLLLKDGFSTAVFGLAMLGSCVAGKPFMYYASKRFSASDGMAEDEWERKWRESPRFRRLFRFVTVVWAVAFLVDALLRVPIVYGLPIDLAAPVTNLLTPITLVGLLLWSLPHMRRVERRERAREVSGAAVGR